MIRIAAGAPDPDGFSLKAAPWALDHRDEKWREQFGVPSSRPIAKDEKQRADQIKSLLVCAGDRSRDEHAGGKAKPKA